MTITAAVGCYNHILWFGSITLKNIQGNMNKIKINKIIALKVTKFLMSNETLNGLYATNTINS